MKKLAKRPLTPVHTLVFEVLRVHGGHLINSRVTGIRFSSKAAYMAWRGLPIQRRTVAALVAAGELTPTKVNAVRQEFRLVEEA